MKDLYLKTEKGTQCIDPKIIEKYHLEAGDLSPCNRYPIVDGNGNGKKKSKKDQDKTKYSKEELMSEGTIFETSEILDIAQGVDSSVENT